MPEPQLTPFFRKQLFLQMSERSHQYKVGLGDMAKNVIRIKHLISVSNDNDHIKCQIIRPHAGKFSDFSLVLAQSNKRKIRQSHVGFDS